MQCTQLRTTAFSGARVQSGVARCSGPSRSVVVVRAVQDLQGKVVSTGMKQSVVVKVERLASHKSYAKRVRVSKNYTAHNEKLDLDIGDYVRLEGCRPLSKTKRFVVAEVIRAAE
jgi:small subunit ribosomal protein S17